MLSTSLTSFAASIGDAPGSGSTPAQAYNTSIWPAHRAPIYFSIIPILWGLAGTAADFSKNQEQAESFDAVAISLTALSAEYG